jgi:glycosyltransferase involved in cell wall biosynthesis
MKKILYIVSTLMRAGPTNQLYNIIKYLDRNEFDPYLITLSLEHEDSRWADYEALGVHLYSLDLSRLQGFLHARKRIQSLLFEIKPDVIHTQGIRGDTISSKLKTKIPKIATVRNLPQFDYIIRYGRIIGKMMCMRHINALRRISICIGVSEAVTDNLKNKYKIREALTIQNGVDTDVYFQANDTEKKRLREKLNLPIAGRILIGSGGVHSDRKDPLFLINVFGKTLSHQDELHLVLLGTGNLQERCRQEGSNNKNIHIIERVNNFVDYLKGSDYYVSSSRAEGLPNAVLEAMACGLPVLLSDIEPHKEIMALAHGAGFCYELGNEANFLFLLDKMMDEDNTVMGRVSLETVKKHFSAQKTSNMYQNIYLKLSSSTIKVA